MESDQSQINECTQKDSQMYFVIYIKLTLIKIFFNAHKNSYRCT